MVNRIRGIGKEVKEQEQFEKILRSLPIRFNPKVLAIEEKKHLENLIVDRLREIHIAYEMRIEDPKKREATFKYS